MRSMAPHRGGHSERPPEGLGEVARLPVADAARHVAQLGVRLLELNVASANLTEPAQLAHAFKQEGIVIDGTPAAVLAAWSLNGASSPVTLTAVDDDAPAA